MKRIEITAENFNSLVPIVNSLVSSGERNIVISFPEQLGKKLRFSDVEMKIKKCLDAVDERVVDVKIENIPHCFLASCTDHIIKAGKKGKVKGRACRNCILFQKCEGVWKKYIDTQGWGEIIWYKPIKNFPKEIPIEVTLRCNLSCEFCFNKDYRTKKELDTGSLKKIIDNISEAGIDAVRFTGGEPLLRKC